MKKSKALVCDPKDIGLKTFFLGPQAENADWLAELFSEILGRWFNWRKSCYPDDGSAITVADQNEPEFKENQRLLLKAVFELFERYEGEVPKFSPRYVGHMFSEISIPGLAGHFLNLLHNPNLISAESGPIAVALENEAILSLVQMVGFDAESGTGHFTSGGTLANFEAIYRARERSALWLAAGALNRIKKGSQQTFFEAAHQGWKLTDFYFGSPELEPLIWTRRGSWNAIPNLLKVYGMDQFNGPALLIPQNKHYSWKKGISVFGLGDDAFVPIELDSFGRLSITDLKRKVELMRKLNRPIIAIVSVMGTTELGEIDPIHEVQDYLDEIQSKEGVFIWHHVDAAYGGYFRTIDLDSLDELDRRAKQAIGSTGRVDSITLDPHKLGYIPYSCGAFLVRSERDYSFQVFDAPYIQYSPKIDRGQFTLEGSRSAGGAAGTWLTSRTIGLKPDGYGRILARTIQIAQRLKTKMNELPVNIAEGCDTNIICFSLGRRGQTLSQCNKLTEKFTRRFSINSNGPFFVSKTVLDRDTHAAYLEAQLTRWGIQADQESLSLVRLCLMNPFFDSKEMQTFLSDEFLEILRDFIQSESTPL